MSRIASDPWTAWGRANPDPSGEFKRIYSHEEASQILQNLGIVEASLDNYETNGPVAVASSLPGSTPSQSCTYLGREESAEAPCWTIWLQSFEQEYLQWAEVAADTMYEECRDTQREKIQMECFHFADWKAWQASSERRNRLEILHRVEGYPGKVAIAMADFPYAFAYGLRPVEIADLVPPPYKMSGEEWTAWLNSEGRWVTIAHKLLAGHDMKQGEEKADNDHEQLIGERPFPTPSGHSSASLRVDRPLLSWTEVSSRHERFARSLRRAGGFGSIVDSLFKQLYGEQN
ncbi:hypothetical protein IFR05_015114 [Cadophora sp. M221]|nr:hypothetical protein IFR05_015114 [Cadophora sp. M221]